MLLQGSRNLRPAAVGRDEGGVAVAVIEDQLAAGAVGVDVVDRFILVVDGRQEVVDVDGRQAVQAYNIHVGGRHVEKADAQDLILRFHPGIQLAGHLDPDLEGHAAEGRIRRVRYLCRKVEGKGEKHVLLVLEGEFGSAVLVVVNAHVDGHLPAGDGTRQGADVVRIAVFTFECQVENLSHLGNAHFYTIIKVRCQAHRHCPQGNGRRRSSSGTHWASRPA